MSHSLGGVVGSGAELFRRVLPCLVLTLLAAGCGTLLNGTTQEVILTSSPAGARATIEPGGLEVVTPAQIELSRKRDYRVRFEHDGYRSQVRQISRQPHAALSFSGPLVPLALVDLASGGGFHLEPDQLTV